MTLGIRRGCLHREKCDRIEALISAEMENDTYYGKNRPRARRMLCKNVRDQVVDIFKVVILVSDPCLLSSLSSARSPSRGSSSMLVAT